MSVLTLIRHGQAMAFAEDPDRLSPLGERQSAGLGEWWRRNGIGFDEIWCGTLRRHRQTARLAGFEYLRTRADWNEYDAGGVVSRLGPELARLDAAFAKLLEASRAARGTAEQNRRFQRMFEPLMKAWAAGVVAADGVESWRDFRARVARGLARILEVQGSRRVAVFTSGGPIGVVVQTVLQCPEPAALELNWRIRNTSLTEFVFTPGRISLDSFNAVPHLDDATFR